MLKLREPGVAEVDGPVVEDEREVRLYTVSVNHRVELQFRPRLELF